MSKSQHVLIALSATFSIFLIAVVCILLFTPALLVWKARRMGRQRPVLWKTPVELTDESVASARGTTLSFSGFEFQIPWDDVDHEKDKAFGAIHLTCFHSGDALWFSSFGPSEFVSGVMKSEKVDLASFRSLFGGPASQSDYAFYDLMLNTTPDSVRLWGPRQSTARNSTLLLTKAIAMPNADTGLYSIHTADRHGFQYGNPQLHPKQVVDDLYSDDGGVEFIFFFYSSKPNAHVLTQADINRVLLSLRKVRDNKTAQNP